MFEILSDKTQTAVQNIQRRAERVVDVAKLHEIYVESGVIGELAIDTNQMIHGRRGVGKTHLLHFYRDHLSVKFPTVIVQIHDCTRLGSGLATDATSPINMAIRTFNQLLNDVATQAFDDLDRLLTADQHSRRTDPSEAVLAFQNAATVGGENGSHFNFRALGDTLDAYRIAAGAEHLLIALDEFVSIPKAAQPFFSEYIKRAFFTKPRITFTIAAVSYSTQTHAVIDGNNIGFEPGADTFGDVNLDQYFVWEEDDRAELFFGQVLFNHLASDLGLDLTLQPSEKMGTLVRYFFTQDKTFSELCRAAEGNCRDLLNIFRAAYFLFRREKTGDRIGIPHIKSGAEEWYRSEKIRNISGDERLEEFLNYLIQSVIRERKTKTFMVSYRDINHPVLTRLFAARLLHPLRTVWTHPDRPGEPYHLVTMDYGCYVALKNTKSAPDERLFFDLPCTDYDDLVPLNDRRSIRRVVVAREDLDRFDKRVVPH